jgi:hypothetical protein
MNLLRVEDEALGLTSAAVAISLVDSSQALAIKRQLGKDLRRYGIEVVW